MYRLLSKARHIIVGLIDFFHKPFAKYIPTQTFRYLACGGSNTVLNWAIYSFAYNILLRRADVHITGWLNSVMLFFFSGMIAHGNNPGIAEPFNITGEVGAYVISFCISFPIGFILSRYIVFPESNLHGRVQFFRYVMATATLILMTYVLIKVFAITLPMVRADISYIFVMVITAVLSYFTQRFFTFKSVEGE